MTAKHEAAIAKQVVTLTVADRAALARRAMLLAVAAIDPGEAGRGDGDGEIDEFVTLQPDVAQAIIEALNEAAMHCFWITRLDEAVTKTPAPSDDEKMAIRLIAKSA